MLHLYWISDYLISLLKKWGLNISCWWAQFYTSRKHHTYISVSFHSDIISQWENRNHWLYFLSSNLVVPPKKIPFSRSTFFQNHPNQDRCLSQTFGLSVNPKSQCLSNLTKYVQCIVVKTPGSLGRGSQGSCHGMQTGFWRTNWWVAEGSETKGTDFFNIFNSFFI